MAHQVDHVRLFADHVSDVVLIGGADGTYEWASPSTMPTLGWSPEEMIGRSVHDFVHPDDAPAVLAVRDAAGAGPMPVMELRWRCRDGSYRWMSARAVAVGADDGSIVNRVVVLREIDAEVLARDRLAESERQFRMLAENASDVVYQTDAQRRLLWVSPSVERLLGWRPDDLVGTSVGDLLIEGGEETKAKYRQGLFSGSAVEVETQFRTADGGRKWMSVNAHPVLDQVGAVVTVVGALRDIDREIKVRRALAMLEASNSILVRVDDEGTLLKGACDAALDAGEYVHATYARAEDHPSDATDDSSLAAVAIHGGHPVVLDHVDAETSIDAFRRRSIRAVASLPVRVGDAIDGALTIWADDLDAFDKRVISVLEELATQIGHGIARIRDAKRLASALHGHSLLVAALDSTPDPVVMLDATRSVTYANPAACRSGFDVDAAARLDGPDDDDITIVPLTDEGGELVAHVLLRHDRASERWLVAELGRQEADRQSLLDVLNSVQPSTSLEAAAASICEVLAALPGVGGAAIVVLNVERSSEPIATAGPLAEGVDDLGRATRDLLAGEEQQVDWFELEDVRSPYRIGVSLHGVLEQRGVQAIASVVLPCQSGMRAGLTLMAGDAGTAMRERALHDIGVLVATLLDPHVDARVADENGRAEMLTVIDEHRFHSVFQPVVDLITMRTTKYEALTRFDNGTRPDVMFNEAHRLGLGVELERACALTALETARALPSWVELSVNLSPPSILAGTAAHVAAVGDDRQLVIEVTEHDAITDYDAIRLRLAEAGLRVSIDDTGAGFAGLQHMIELQPDVVKLDIGLVRGIDTDPIRQALATGLCYFANETGMMLVAEGIETEAEAATVRRLGIHLGQGYLFGKPERIPQP